MPQGPHIPLLQAAAGDLRILARVLTQVAAGLRDVADIAQRLRAEEPVVGECLALARWLGFVSSAAPPSLTRRGLEFLFGSRSRRRVYADAVAGDPLGRKLLASVAGAAPSTADALAVLQGRYQQRPQQELEAQARSLAALAAPAAGYARRTPARVLGEQLPLAFPRPRRPVSGFRLRLPADRAGLSEDPALYRTVLQALLDEGELAITHLHGILDDVGAAGVAAGSYAEMALRRGDAFRRSESGLDKIVVTPAAIARRDLSDTVASVALSDPQYRAYLEVLRATGRGDASAAARYGHLRTRFTHWDAMLFGADVPPRQLARAADKLLRGRTLDAIPLAASGDPVRGDPDQGSVDAPALSLLDRSDLVLALPPSLEVLVCGVSAINGLLRQAQTTGASLPGALDPRAPTPAGRGRTGACCTRERHHRAPSPMASPCGCKPSSACPTCSTWWPCSCSNVAAGGAWPWPSGPTACACSTDAATWAPSWSGRTT